MGLPGTRDPQVARAPDRAQQAVPGDAHARRRRSSATSPGLNAAREAQNAIIGDSEPLRKDARERAGQARQRDRLQRPDPVPAAAVRDPRHPRRLPASCACTSRSRASAPRSRRARRLEAEAPGEGSQARQRRQPGGHSAIDERAARRRRRRPDAAGDGHRGHHRRDRRLGQLHRRGAAHAGRRRCRARSAA